MDRSILLSIMAAILYYERTSTVGEAVDVALKIEQEVKGRLFVQAYGDNQQHALRDNVVGSIGAFGRGPNINGENR
jgi:hypothetical protein